MSVADLHDLELIWPSLGPTDVIATGTFDQWSSSIHLVKGDTGFSETVKVPWGQKVAYKFIVDGRWRCRDDLPQEDDGHGNMNNVLRTPEKPQFRAVQDPLARLSIPFNGAQISEGHGDIENMVTAVEFLPSAGPHTIKGSLPLPISQTTADALAQEPSAGTPVSESKLNTAAATEGHVSPGTSETPAKPFKESPLSCDVSPLPINGSGSPLLPSVNGTTHDSPSVPSETAKEEAIFAPLQSAAPQSDHSSHRDTARDTPAPTDPVDVPPVPAPAAVLEPTQVDLPQQATSSTSIHASTSAPASGASTHKKRQSWFAKIKHIFDKDHNKQERKKNKH